MNTAKETTFEQFSSVFTSAGLEHGAQQRVFDDFPLGIAAPDAGKLIQQRL